MTTTHDAHGHENPRTLVSSDLLVGATVRNLEGEELGSVKAVMLDTAHGRIAYAVLSFGGFLGFGDKLFAIPWSTLRFDRDNESLVLDVDKARLARASGFDKDHWPDFADPRWGAETHAFWESTPYWEERPSLE